MSYPQLQGAASQLIQQPGDTLTEARNGLATLVRSYWCALSYADTARSVLVKGYVPSDYPYMALFNPPDETIENGIAKFRCTFYGVLSTSKYNQPYDYFESQLLNGSVQYFDPYGPNITISPINGQTITSPINGQTVQKTFSYFSPAIIRSYVLPSSQGVTFNQPVLSDFNGFPVSTFNTQYKVNGVANVIPYRDLDAERIVVKSGGIIIPSRSTVTSYGIVDVVECVFQLSLPTPGQILSINSVFLPYYFSLGSGDVATCSIYIDPSKHYTAPVISNLTAAHGSVSDFTTHYSGLSHGDAAPPAVPENPVQIALSWNNTEPATDQFPQIIFNVSSTREYYGYGSTIGSFINNFQTIDHSGVSIPKINANDSNDPFTTGKEPGIYTVTVSSSEQSTSNPPLTYSFVQCGPASQIQNIKSLKRGAVTDNNNNLGIASYGKFSFQEPWWDGISNDKSGDFQSTNILGFAIPDDNSLKFIPISEFTYDGTTQPGTYTLEVYTPNESTYNAGVSNSGIVGEKPYTSSFDSTVQTIDPGTIKAVTILGTGL
jgi:hypothetical protein